MADARTAGLSARRVLLPEGVGPARLAWSEPGILTEVEPLDPADPVDLTDGLVAPGFVDLQVNGFAGSDVTTGGESAVRAMARVLPATGVTAFAPTVITADWPVMRSAVLAAAVAARSPQAGAARVAAVHVEGPFLSPQRRGIHPLQHLRNDVERLPDLLDGLLPVTSLGVIVTLAPELPNALDVIRELVDVGVTVSIGHSDAPANLAAAAFDAGARMVTHLFNAQSAVSNRAPGVATAAMLDDRVALGVIADLEHVDPWTLRLVWRLAGPRVVLVTDAMATADPSDGRPAPRDRDGRLAGSALSMARAVRNLAGVTTDLAGALRAASSSPARVLGALRDDAGTLEPGHRADLVWLADDGTVRQTWLAGQSVFVR